MALLLKDKYQVALLIMLKFYVAQYVPLMVVTPIILMQ